MGGKGEKGGTKTSMFLFRATERRRRRGGKKREKKKGKAGKAASPAPAPDCIPWQKGEKGKAGGGREKRKQKGYKFRELNPILIGHWSDEEEEGKKEKEEKRRGEERKRKGFPGGPSIWRNPFCAY